MGTRLEWCVLGPVLGGRPALLVARQAGWRWSIRWAGGRVGRRVFSLAGAGESWGSTWNGLGQYPWLRVPPGSGRRGMSREWALCDRNLGGCSARTCEAGTWCSADCRGRVRVRNDPARNPDPGRRHPRRARCPWPGARRRFGGFRRGWGWGVVVSRGTASTGAIPAGHSWTGHTRSFARAEVMAELVATGACLSDLSSSTWNGRSPGSSVRPTVRKGVPVSAPAVGARSHRPRRFRAERRSGIPWDGGRCPWGGICRPRGSPQARRASRRCSTWNRSGSRPVGATVSKSGRTPERIAGGPEVANPRCAQRQHLVRGVGVLPAGVVPGPGRSLAPWHRSSGGPWGPRLAHDGVSCGSEGRISVEYRKSRSSGPGVLAKQPSGAYPP